MSAPPPPPPPPPPRTPANAGASSTSVGGAAAALFAEICEGGENIASRLRHVTDDLKSYKQNVQHGEIDMSELERKKAAAEARRLAQEQSERPTGGEAMQQPVLALEGDKRWVVKYQVGSAAKQLQLELDKAEMRHAIRIENCQQAYINITNKVNSVSIVHCAKVQVALHVVVSSLEVLNCVDVDVQVAHAAPTIDIERSTSVNVYLLDKEEARNTEIVTACSSTVNVLFPSEKDDDIVERAVPEQFVTRIVPDSKGDWKLRTTPKDSF
ncbi:hypothetical protein LSCM1_00592 [Leishmania martiniquensis]|uniref:C-CAP/cofactor C-like domain-containing protein n=1 Tax=Leishmania martiniquensis TaxID=1580590 RepID=A0A836KG82_9TRYP|nr:hypothetical protein LSCM1_00592 [Leishmania martiniquensis]